MSAKIIEFNLKHTLPGQDVNAILAQDPYFKFIHDLLTTMADMGFPFDTAPQIKARELYAQYQRDNLIAQWKRDLEAEMAEKSLE